MAKPKHIPAKAWATAQELLTTAPGKWRSGICAGAWIAPNGSLAAPLFKENGDG